MEEENIYIALYLIKFKKYEYKKNIALYKICQVKYHKLNKYGSMMHIYIATM